MSETSTEATATDAEGAQSDAVQPEQKVDTTDWKAKAREWEKRAKENKSAADELTALKESQKTEQQRLAERAEAAERSAAEAQRELVRLRVISEVGLPADLHEFVVGNDEDELRAKATKLKAQFGADYRSVDVGLGPRQTGPAQDMNSLIRQQVAARRGA
jgi:hypothetical protein